MKKTIRFQWIPALLALGWGGHLGAQDMRFTQYNALPTSLNPGYVGVSERSQVASLYRSQWSSLPNGFIGWHVAHDSYNRRLNSGFGILFSQEQAGAGALGTTKVALQYAYEVP
ncbi:MAG: type IX secretion system membrane protein PorP/SprF, partial [Flavobacteriales bacterium]